MPPIDHFRRASVRGLLLFAVLVVAGLESRARAAEAPPNFVLIVSDDQGYHDLGCFAGADSTIRTPALDELAAGGVKLTSFYVAWPACTPSRAALLTGRYPQRNGLYDMIRNDVVDFGRRMTEEEYAVSPEMTLGLDLREVTIAEVLHEAGYATGVFGKWDSGRPRRFLPLQRGFDDFFGFANTGIDYWTHERYGIPSMFRGNERVKVEGYATDLFRDEAIRFLRENARQPFFLYVPFNAPHSASNLDRPGVQAPEEYIQMYPAGTDRRSELQRVHKAAVTCMDDAIADILATLDDLGVADDTIVLFLSDNGGSGSADNGPLRGRKAQMFEGGLRVPAIARWPGRIPAGGVSDDFLTALEVFPTFAAAAGTPMPADIVYDGFDMMPVLAGDQPSKRTKMFWQRRSDKAARVGSYKWVESAKGNGLFDLANDLGEQHDLSEARPELLERMQTEFAAWQAEMEAAEPRGPFRNY